MELSSLARKQKRIKDWSTYLEEHVFDEGLKRRTSETLQQYRNLIAKCWEQERISESDELHLVSLERELEELNEEARMTIVPKRQR